MLASIGLFLYSRTCMHAAKGRMHVSIPVMGSSTRFNASKTQAQALLDILQYFFNHLQNAPITTTHINLIAKIIENRVVAGHWRLVFVIPTNE